MKTITKSASLVVLLSFAVTQPSFAVQASEAKEKENHFTASVMRGIGIGGVIALAYGAYGAYRYLTGSQAPQEAGNAEENNPASDNQPNKDFKQKGKPTSRPTTPVSISDGAGRSASFTPNGIMTSAQPQQAVTDIIGDPIQIQRQQEQEQLQRELSFFEVRPTREPISRERILAALESGDLSSILLEQDPHNLNQFMRELEKINRYQEEIERRFSGLTHGGMEIVGEAAKENLEKLEGLARDLLNFADDASFQQTLVTDTGVRYVRYARGEFADHVFSRVVDLFRRFEKMRNMFASHGLQTLQSLRLFSQL